MSGRQIWILNGALAFLLLWGAVKLVDGWKAFAESHQASQVKPKPAAAELKVAPVQVAAATAAGTEGWQEIASSNPFSFYRNDVNISPVEPPSKVVATPKPILFGTILLGDQRLAFLGRAGAGHRTGPALKVGEAFDGWKVVDIKDKSVVVAASGIEESLVVGRVPIERSYEKTTAAPPLPATPAVAPASRPSGAAPGPSAGVNSINSWRPGMPAPPGTRVVRTPFGDSLEQDGR